MKLSSNFIKSADLPVIYLPHHAVFKESSTTTKLRVVFDGSAKSNTGFSLNDSLMKGPVLQQDLISIIMRFRIHKYVLTADIAKMYRQVMVNNEHTQLQRILWRNSPSEEVQSYDLLTITYGTTPASFLSVRVIHELSEIERKNFPIASQIATRDFYVDDLLTGANSVEECTIIRDQLITMLNLAGFELRKWISNCTDLTKIHSNEHQEHLVVDLDKYESLKTLGLSWNAKNDSLHYVVSSLTNEKLVTKRSILSNIAKLFDPLGLIGPVIVVAKLFMQQLWQLNLSWDETVSSEMHTRWLKFSDDLHELNTLQIPRCTIKISIIEKIELHGFCDSSENAYGACVYLRVMNSEEFSMELMCSKSRVAPLKNLSLPRLELCGALLLAHLLNKVKQSITFENYTTYCWTDSTITLTWITSTSRIWKTFVANRVSEIQELTKGCVWQHIKSKENPADILSRGCSSTSLINSKRWWNGPEWLNNNQSLIINPINVLTSDIPEQRIITTLALSHDFCLEIFNKFSNFLRLIRVIAYCQRFINNLKHKIDKANQKYTGSLSVAESDSSTIFIIKKLQQASFSEEIKSLSSSSSAQQVKRKSNILNLNPFLDSNDIIRVGGRLKYSNLDYSYKHPIILPKSHHITKLIINHEHVKHFHAGLQATLAAVRSKYWPLSAKNTTKQIIRNCVICFKAKPTSIQPIMGNLPATRITPTRPFTNTGVDYFGPLYTRDGKRRNSKLIKSYGVIFICFATKAIHLELVGDLSTETFINSLKRFISRRGNPENMYSDNGSNFIGAAKELSKNSNISIDEFKNTIRTSMTNERVNWHFIPPRSPHFGGLWEAGVKSCKHHIKRVLGNASLHFEEMYTLLVRIEAIVNSRPLTPLSSDPNDLSFLTPAHFLIGDYLTAPTEVDLTTTKLNRLSRWQHVQQLQQHYWKRWHKEYLHSLQERGKWKSTTADLTPGTLVIIREDNVPPLRWPMARVESVHPGQDGVVRAATVRTSSGTFKRSVVKLCPLPLPGAVQ